MIKLGLTETFAYYDFDSSRQAAVPAFVPVVLWDTNASGHGSLPSDINAQMHHVVTLPKPTSTRHYFDADPSAGTVFMNRQPIVGVTQAFALHGYQVAVQLNGITQLLVNTTVNPGDILFLGGTSTANLLLTRTSSQTPFSRLPEIRPLIHPVFGKDFIFLIPSVVAVSPQSNLSGAFSRTAFGQGGFMFPIGIALSRATADASNNPQIIRVKLIEAPIVF